MTNDKNKIGLRVVSQDSGGFLAPRPRRGESPEISLLRERVYGSGDSSKECARLAVVGITLARAARDCSDSKQAESVETWLEAHLQDVRRGGDPYDRVDDLREAVMAAADELESVSLPDDTARREVYANVFGFGDRLRTGNSQALARVHVGGDDLPRSRGFLETNAVTIAVAAVAALAGVLTAILLLRSKSK